MLSAGFLNKYIIKKKKRNGNMFETRTFLSGRVFTHEKRRFATPAVPKYLEEF